MASCSATHPIYMRMPMDDAVIPMDMIVAILRDAMYREIARRAFRDADEAEMWASAFEGAASVRFEFRRV